MTRLNKILTARLITRLAYLILFFVGISSNNLVLLFITITAFLLGPIFCGWMCFFGFYQDILRYIGSFIKKEPFEIDERIHKYLKYFRYIVLAGTLTVGGLFLFPDEVKTHFSQLLKGRVLVDGILYFLIILGVISLFTRRFFCRYLCMDGARLGLYSLLKPITISRDSACVSCNLCRKNCPMKIKAAEIVDLANPNCISCLTCVGCCPKNSLKVKPKNYRKLIGKVYNFFKKPFG